MNNNYITVSDINKIIKRTIEDNDDLMDVYLKGEISNLKFHSRGHLYFSLKDESSKINAVMFNYTRTGIKFTPKDGDQVLVHGRVSVYEASGSYQIYVDFMEQDGIGNLYVLFEELKKKLSSEGLFDKEHKKRIRRVPRKIGVITAPTGAAIKDIISTINKRFPMTEIVVFPTLVQGENAAPNIVRMINLANTFEDIDTIILGRGGGSIEDLWAFNEEIVARSIYDSRIPIISGVGHEIDFTISDFVADHRSLTPTAAMVDLLPDSNELHQKLDIFQNTLEAIISSKFNKCESYLNLAKAQIKSKAIEQKINLATLTLDSFKSNLDNFLHKKFNLAQSKIDKFELVFKRQEYFYKVTKNMAHIIKDSQIISLSELKSGDEITISSQNLCKQAIIK